MPAIKHIAACLWFDSQAEDAANFYVSVFDDAKIVRIARYTDAGFDIHHKPAGSVLTVEFELSGYKFTALNGGPELKMNEGVSFEIHCESQDEIDYYWEKLGEGGDPKAQVCGWLKDKFGVSWQVVPAMIPELVADSDKTKVSRMLNAMFAMKKLDIAKLEQAFNGE